MQNIITRVVISCAVMLAAATVQAQEATPVSHAADLTAKAAPGYLIANFTIRDQATFQKYLEAVRPLTLKYKGRAVVFNTNVRKVEGHPYMVMAVIEFPNLAEAERFYFSSEYAEVRKLRIASTEGSVVLTEGFISSEK